MPHLPDAQETAAVAAVLSAPFPAPVSVSPDGGYLLLKDFGERDFTLLVRDRRSSRTVLSLRGQDSQLAPAWRPDCWALAFFADRGGDEQYALHVVDLRSGAVRVLQAPTTSLATLLTWSPDGRHLAYLAAPPGSRTRSLLVVDPYREGNAVVASMPDVALRAGMAWSPTSRQIATVRRLDPGVLVVSDVDGRTPREIVIPGSEIREIAWAPGGEAVLVTLRRPGGTFTTMAEVALPDGAVRYLGSPGGEASRPLYAPDGKWLAYHLNVDSELTAFLCDRGGASCRSVTVGDGSTYVLGFSPRGDSMYLAHEGRTAPRSLYISGTEGRGSPRLVYGPRGDSLAPAVAGIRVDIPTGDSLTVPAYVWRTTRRENTSPSAVIRVHGGPALQAPRTWDGGIQYLLSAGCDVVAVNYRGSTGYGTRFERAPGGDAARVGDVLAARDYAVKSLGIPPGRVGFFGHSYGAYLVARAVAVDSLRAAGAVLVSPVGPGADTGLRARQAPPTLVFHGANDVLQAPAGARSAVERMLGDGALRAPRGEFRVFEKEGHNFHQIESWAEVHAATAALLCGGSR